MKNAVKMILVLAIVGVISGGMLAGVYNYANPLIKENEEREFRQNGIYKLFPDAADYRKVIKDDAEAYEVTDKKGADLGYAFLVEGNGYQGKIKIVAAVDPRFMKLEGIEVLESSETPGLGGEAAKEPFKSQFRGLPISSAITYTKSAASKDKNASVVQAIAGATITTRSVVNMLNEELSRIKKAFNK